MRTIVFVFATACLFAPLLTHGASRLYTFTDEHGVAWIGNYPQDWRRKPKPISPQAPIAATSAATEASASNSSLPEQRSPLIPTVQTAPRKTANSGEDIDALIRQTARRYGLDEALLHSVIRVESAYNANARSTAGAIGLMQLMPATGARYGVRDRTNPGENLRGGAQYLRDLLDQFNNNLRHALAAYNAGEGAVLKHGGVPPYRETQEYVSKVMNLYQHESGCRQGDRIKTC